MPEPRGRPSSYTPEIASRICERLAAGESLRSICRDEDMPPAPTVREWVVRDVDKFSEQYALARDMGLDAMADETLEIADDGTNDWIEKELDSGRIIEVPDHEHINRSRLRVDARKWYLSKLAPKRYGETRPELNIPSSTFQLVVLSAGMTLPAIPSSVGFVIDAEPA